ncbi:MAG: YceI family protein [Pseudomonadota bacterium]
MNTFMKYPASLIAIVSLAACGGPSTESDTPIAAEPAPPEAETVEVAAAALGPIADVTSGDYTLDLGHAFLTFKVGHSGGISSYRVTMNDYTAKLGFNAETPEQSSLSVTINPMGVETNYTGDFKASHPESAFDSWNEDLSRDTKWLNADAHPEITFEATSIARTSENAGTVTGDLTLLGMTKPVTLDVTYNGHANVPWYGERDIVGFDATTTLIRSEWGMGAYIPMIGDQVDIAFSGEFVQDE